MNWTALWMTLFGTAQWLGIDLGFWAAMAVTGLVVIGMNLIFWTRKPCS